MKILNVHDVNIIPRVSRPDLVHLPTIGHQAHLLRPKPVPGQAPRPGRRKTGEAVSRDPGSRQKVYAVPVESTAPPIGQPRLFHLPNVWRQARPPRPELPSGGLTRAVTEKPTGRRCPDATLNETSALFMK